MPSRKVMMAFPVLDGLRTADPTRVQMLHQGEEEREILSRDALFVERQNEIAALRMDEKIRVLHPLGNTFVRQQLADVVPGKKSRKIVRRNVGVDGHLRYQMSDVTSRGGRIVSGRAF